jgi:hypothetical protein
MTIVQDAHGQARRAVLFVHEQSAHHRGVVHQDVGREALHDLPNIGSLIGSRVDEHVLHVVLELSEPAQSCSPWELFVDFRVVEVPRARVADELCSRRLYASSILTRCVPTNVVAAPDQRFGERHERRDVPHGGGRCDQNARHLSSSLICTGPRRFR